MPPTRRAALHAIAADASRQLGFSRQSITHADAGLALLPAGDLSDLSIRMRTVRALKAPTWAASTPQRLNSRGWRMPSAATVRWQWAACCVIAAG
jgi:hypothetical protein